MNKICNNDMQLKVMEKKIINFKLALLNSYFTFNKENYDLDYLNALNKFLFNDFYDESELGYRKITDIEKKLLNSYLEKIVYLCAKEPDNIRKILRYVEEIWHYQPFTVGNTRTLLGFINVLNDAFNLNLNLDFNLEIFRGEEIFKLGYIVNRKRLTMYK